MFIFGTAGLLVAQFTTTYLNSFHHRRDGRRQMRPPWPYSGREVQPPRRDGSREFPFSKNVVKLTCESTAKGGICEVYLVGTTHFHPKSMQEVKNVVNFVKPQVVFLELCPARASYLNPYEVANEFRVAVEETRKYGSKVVLGDRHFQITTARYFVKSFFSSSFEIVQFPFENVLYPCRKTFLENYDDPLYVEIYVDERDQYMSAMLLKVARVHNSVVAVVGKGHLPGIQKYWEQPIKVEKLLHSISMEE